MKIILTLSIFLICFLQLGQSVIDPSQKDVMSDLLFNLYRYSKSLDPCDHPYVLCKTINSTSTLQTVTDLNFGAAAIQEYVVTQDLTPLQNLTNMYIGYNIYLTSSFFNYVNKFSQLTLVNLYSLKATIPDDTIFPASLETFFISRPSVPIGRAIFESNVKYLYINYPLIGYSLPTLINVNPYLENLQLQLTFYSGYPSNLSQVFPNLQDLEIQVDNDMNQNNYSNFSISNIGVFKNLKSLRFRFTNGDNPQELYINSFLSNVPKIDYIYINGLGVSIDPSVGILDFSYIKAENNFELQIQQSSILNNCKGTCVKFPKNSSFRSSLCAFSYNGIDFSNLQYFQDSFNDYEQNLPNIDNAPLLNEIEISLSIVVGNIPESYCRINKLSLHNNELNGTVPSCIQCLGGNKVGSMVLPNPLLNFNKTSEPYCPSFKIDQNYTNVLPTDGTEKIIITGTNLGWAGNYLTTIIPNSKLAITIPRGVGTNKSITVTFQNGEQRTFYYNYIPPFIKSYSVLEFDGQKFFTINGTGFDFENSNKITINGQQITFYNAIGGGDNDGMIELPIEELPNFASESKFTVSAFIGGQSSNEVTFYYFNSINITEEKLVLNNTGGSVDITGLFGTNNISLVSVSINGTICLVTSYTSSKLTIKYPSNQIGDNYVLTLNVGGYAVNLVVEYIQGEIPTPSPTPSTTPSTTPTQSPSTTPSTTPSATPSPTPSTTPTTTPTQSPSTTPTQSPDDDVSTSSTLSISFYLITLLLLIHNLFNN
ncbi:hypothetical protein ACTFIZ_011548 [Dictyostelium cf. discoideum]